MHGETSCCNPEDKDDRKGGKTGEKDDEVTHYLSLHCLQLLDDDDKRGFGWFAVLLSVPR